MHTDFDRSSVRGTKNKFFVPYNKKNFLIMVIVIYVVGKSANYTK